MASKSKKPCTLRFFIKVVPNTGKARPRMSPMLTVVWRMGWSGASGASSTGKATTRRMDVDVRNVANVSGGVFGGGVRYELLKLNPAIVKTDAQAKALLKRKSFTWKDDALAICLQKLDVSLLNAVETKPFCTACP